MKIKTLTLFIIIAASFRLEAQYPQLVEPKVPRPWTPPVVSPPVIISQEQQQQQQQYNAPPPQQNLPSAPMAEFETLKFIATSAYPYFADKQDYSLPIVKGQIPRQDMAPIKRTRLPKGKSRIVFGKTKWLNIGYTMAKNWELRAMAVNKGADELIASPGRKFSDGGEVLIKFVRWQ